VARPTVQVGGLTAAQRSRRLVADVLVGGGASEAVTIPLVAPADLVAAGAPVDRTVEATNPLRAEESVLRTSVLPGLLRVVGTNAARGLDDVAVFELGRVFLAPVGSDELLPEQPWRVAAVVAGSVARSPVEPDRPVDAFDAVDLVRQVAEGLELADVRFEATTTPGFHPSRALAVLVDGRPVGTVGEVAADVRSAFGINAPAAAFEVDLDALLGAARRDRAFVPLSPFPPSTIDLAFVVDEPVSAGDVERTLRDALGAALEAVRCFDEYRDESIGEGRKSLAFALRLRSRERTQTDDDIAALRQRAIDAVADAHSATLRG